MRLWVRPAVLAFAGRSAHTHVPPTSGTTVGPTQEIGLAKRSPLINGTAFSTFPLF